MVKIVDTREKNIGFDTSVKTGTKVQSSGDDLSAIVAGALAVKKGYNKAERVQETLDDKSSTLALNDMKIGYQKSWNEYDFNDRDNPSSSELMDFHDKIRKTQSELRGMLNEGHGQAYDLFHAGKDGDIQNVIGEEAKFGAKNLMATSIMGFSTMDEVNELGEALNGMAGSTADNLKGYTDAIEGYLDSDMLKGLTSEQIIRQFPLLTEIKNPEIGKKIKKHLIELGKKETIAAGSNSGESTAAMASRLNLPTKEVLDIQKEDANKLVGSGNPDDFKRGIEIANHNGIRLTSLDNLPEKVIGSVDSEPTAAVKFLKQYTDTKGTYNYTDKQRESLDAFDIVGRMYGLDMSTEEGVQAAAFHIKDANRPDAPKFEMPTNEKIIEESNPLGFDSSSNYGEDRLSYVGPRVRELMKYTNGNLEKAVDIAEDEYEDFRNKPWYSVDGASAFGSNQPVGMFAENEDEIEMVKEQYSLDTEADSVELKYIGGNQWSLTTIDDNGKEDTKFRSASQLKAAVKERRIFRDSLETLDAVVSNTKVSDGDTLREKQINADSKIVKNAISKQRKTIEEKIGKKLSGVQKEELNKAIIPLLKEKVRQEDYKSRHGADENTFGFNYDKKTETVGFSFGQAVEDIMNTIMGVEIVKNEEPIGTTETVTNQEIIDTKLSEQIEVATNEEIMGSILEAEMGAGTKIVEGQLHAGQETITAANPNGELNTTNYGVMIKNFPKKRGEKDLAHAQRYYSEYVTPAISKVKGIENAPKNVVIGLSKLVWNKGNIIKGLDLNDSKGTISTLLDVTTTSGKHSNGVINRSIKDYALIAKELGYPEVAFVKTTKAVGGKYRVQYLDNNQNIIHDDERKASTAAGSKIKAGKTYAVRDNNITIS